MSIHGTVAVTGDKGRLGSMLTDPSVGFAPLDCDITDYNDIVSSIKEVDPTIIINCAAYSNVDEAEFDEEEAYKVNQNGVLNLRTAFKGWLIHLSTDYIFGGVHGPYSEVYRMDKDPAVGTYGKSKAYGEQYILNSQRPGTIIRTTMLYGNPKFPDFVTKVLDRLSKGVEFEVPMNLVGSPTYIPHLIEGIVALMSVYQYNHPPILNISGTDIVSRYEFALMIASVWGYDKGLIIPTTKDVGIAKRPHKAGFRLGKASKLGIPLYSAIDGLMEMQYARGEEI